MQQTIVNFLGIGVQKAGTSWLHANLKKHPEIWMPPRKELHYFDRSITYPSPSFLASDSFSKRVNSQEEHNKDFKRKLEKELNQALKSNNHETIKWYLNYFLGTCNDDWYNSLFEQGRNKISGEITPAYSFLSPKDIKHIYKNYPELKIILILRNPVERAWSHIRFYIKLNKFSEDSSIEEMKNFIDSKEQVLRSDYLSIIHNWSSIFSKKQIHICFYDEIKENPQNFLNKVFNFLEISPLILDQEILNKKVNVSTVKTIPKELELYINKKYYSHLKNLEKILGSYTHNWVRNTENILNKEKLK